MKSYLGIIAGAVICLSACGDSGTKGSDNENSATPENAYATEENLPGCLEEHDGEVAYVEEDNSAYKCENSRWVNKGEYVATSNDIKNCTAKREGAVAYIADKEESLVCQDGKWVKEGDDEAIQDSEKSSSSTSRQSNPESSSDKAVSNSSSSSKFPEPAEGSSSSTQKGSSSSGTQSEVEGSSSSVKSSSSLSSSSATSSSSVSSSSSSAKSSSSSPFSYGVLKDDRDGKTYKTIVIGSQTWMAENLAFEYKIKTESCHAIRVRLLPGRRGV